MYTDFYHLKEMPFTLTPSPRFLYLGEAHREALALLTYGVAERKGFILLTGEMGTGKTTMIQALLSTLDESTHSIHLANPLLSPGEFMDYLASSAFHKKLHVRSKAHFLLAFEKFLRQCLHRKKTVILIIDEAQHLSFELLEEIRLLSNMESADEKLITIFLVGQPELYEKLRDQRCRPLYQRIGHRYQISPLDRKETENYVTTRLRVAGAHHPSDIFPQRTIEAIYRYSCGYPRLINSLADNALLLGYSTGRRQITPPLIEHCYEDMSAEGSLLEGRRSTLQTQITKRVPLIRYGKWAAALCCLLAVLAFGVSHRGRNLFGQLFRSKPAGYPALSDKVPPGEVKIKIKKPPKREGSLSEPHPKKELSSLVPRARKEASTDQTSGNERSIQNTHEELSLPLSVSRGVICRGVSHRKPIASGERFPVAVGMLYCFTKIVGAQSPTQITHVWYFGDTVKARVPLKVGSSSWRTYSAHTIGAHEVGAWHVKVLGPRGEVLKALRFKITP